MKRKIAALLIGLAVAGCAGQAATPTSRPIPTTARTTPAPAAGATAGVTAPPDDPPADWQRAWLRGEPCAAPCFLGITPGTSTQTETLELMRNTFPTAEAEQVPALNTEPSFIAWFRPNENRGVSAYFYEQPPRFNDAPVNTITNLLIAAPDLPSFSEVTGAFGEPSHVLALAHDYDQLGVRYFLAVVYLDHGILLWFETNKGMERPDLAPDLAVVQTTFFPASLETFDASVDNLFPVRTVSSLLVPWQGFQPFAAYCRETRPDASRKGCQ